ncbi:hypothetical protein HYE54_12000 [Aggregatibacter actinomycetemcomitans]|uniref:DUF2570 domain-containing protein n=1 Tax=Aggregatibacter actinomycetemcomitans TaxID=714 RepID=A0A5D0EM87_AGGAC|nr:hypothetical protein [Aggregatibacter actinomycetemcomitans]NP_852748.1 hypothetical protein Aaphi23p24 [Haemophilus phage Aaphi23]YP_003344815.1 hypothetical protein D11S_2242 [Aggregatibacter phage S1249]ACX80315.1 hypothetical protein D11S_2242 [Aggregatibacter phage S1249]AMQ94621.1 hypothetical protein ACT75_08880 [Aggregatibacter actinomycetemcomitans]MBN6069422.1 hypothetical protein [Aggregatibacter actinomycetemcomitans]MBN6087084.1 hypothetical protein [Aggregatibacter actinomyce
MSQAQALRISSILDNVFTFLLLIGCLGLFVQIYKQNDNLSALQNKYDQMVVLADQRMKRIDALQANLSDRNDKIELLMQAQEEERKANGERIDAIRKIIKENRCVRNSGISGDVINRLLKSE